MFLCFDGLLTWNCLGEDWIMGLRLGKCVGKYVRLGKYVRIICSASYVRCLCQVPSKCLPIPQISSSSSSRALFPELWPLRITSAGSRALRHQAGQWGALLINGELLAGDWKSGGRRVWPGYYFPCGAATGWLYVSTEGQCSSQGGLIYA